MFEGIAQKFIFKAVARAAFATAGRVASLDHEIVNDAVKDQVIIESLTRQKDEVVDGFGGIFWVKSKFYRSFAGFYRCSIGFFRVNLHFRRAAPLLF